MAYEWRSWHKPSNNGDKKLMQNLLDPTGELDPISKKPLRKIKATTSTIIGLIDISKAKGDVFLDRIEKLFIKKGYKQNDIKNLLLPAPRQLA